MLKLGPGIPPRIIDQDNDDAGDDDDDDDAGDGWDAPTFRVLPLIGAH